MINSRKIEDLHPRLQTLALQHVLLVREQLGLDLLIYCTFRDYAAQAALYAQGRSIPGRIVTKARPGRSFHNFRLAYDCVPLIGSKPLWSTRSPADAKVWNSVGELGESLGLEWGGRWRSFKEMAHFQFSGGLTLAELREGKTLEVA